jgi:DNA-binding XRE family transcriptional regulator
MIMAIRRVRREIERNPEQTAELRAARADFQATKPSLDDLVASGDYQGPHRHGDVMAFLSAIATLKRRRDELGLSLADVSERSGLDKGMISRLETGKVLNPTISTLWRYAEALGMKVGLSVEPAPAAGL